MLEEADRVGVADRADQQALGVGRRRRRHDLQPRRLQEPRLRVLRVERAAREPAARGQPDHDRHRQALAVVHLRGDVDELVEPAGDEVGELHLADRLQALDRGADGGADDRVLGQRRVEHPLGAELLGEAVGDLERAAEGADVLADAEDASRRGASPRAGRRRSPPGRSSRGSRSRRSRRTGDPFAAAARRSSPVSVVSYRSGTTARGRRRAARQRSAKTPSIAIARAPASARRAPVSAAAATSRSTLSRSARARPRRSRARRASRRA